MPTTITFANSIFQPNSPALTLNSSDTLTVEVGGYLMSSIAVGAVRLDGLFQVYDLAINGMVLGLNVGTSGIYVAANSLLTLTVGQGGKVYGQGGGVFTFGTANITNFGEISTASASVAAIQQLGGGDSTLTNAGMIASAENGILVRFTGSGLHTINNYGLIGGLNTVGVAIKSDHAAAVENIQNAGGIIYGDLDLGGGDDVVNTFNGRIGGVVQFGGGADELDGSNVYADTAFGGTDNDVLRGNGGNDVLAGEGGADELDGGAGSDTLTGGTENDTYIVDSKSDVIVEIAGEGFDTVLARASFSLAADDDIEVLATASATGTTAINLTGNALAQRIIGNAGANVLDGGKGADRLEGGLGNDTYIIDSASDVLIETGAGIDTVRSTVSKTLGAGFEKLVLLGSASLNGTGNSAANVLTGNTGKNTLKGLAGNDTLSGGKGKDVLIGGSGKDTMSGGTQADRFDFNKVSEIGKGAKRDVIKDFSVSGGDVIDLKTIDANTKTTKNDAFSFIKAAAFHHQAGELHYVKQNPHGTALDKTVVEGDVNGDGKADFQLELTGLKSLTAGDFAL